MKSETRKMQKTKILRAVLTLKNRKIKTQSSKNKQLYKKPKCFLAK